MGKSSNSFDCNWGITLKVGYIQIIDRVNIYNKAVDLWQRSFPVELIVD